jgi:hypothetical protein
MIEILILALLIWLWVIERRLSVLLVSDNARKLDIDGLRIEIANLKAEPARLPDTPAAHDPLRNTAVG